MRINRFLKNKQKPDLISNPAFRFRYKNEIFAIKPQISLLKIAIACYMTVFYS
jgi:hypothetical protein